MEELYRELSECLGGSSVIELKKTGFAKDLAANLFAAGCLKNDPLKDISHEAVCDRRIKVFVAAADDFGRLEKAIRLLRTYTPDLKIFAAAPDMTDLPALSTGFLQTDPESAIFAVKFLQAEEGLLIGQQAGAVLAAAITLAKNESYQGYNILVYLSEDK